jgi:hypothetical protein
MRRRGLTNEKSLAYSEGNLEWRGRRAPLTQPMLVGRDVDSRGLNRGLPAPAEPVWAGGSTSSRSRSAQREDSRHEN